MKFIEKIINEINIENFDYSKTVLIFPTKRACVFFENYFKKMQNPNSTYWLPQTYSIKDFVKELTRWNISDKIDLVFKLFVIYKNHYADGLEFDIFYKWSEMFISDFNDIDLYCVDEKKIFKNLQELSKIESYGLYDTQLTEKEVLKKFFDFTEKMDFLYEALQNQLKNEHSAYYGMALNEIHNNHNVIFKRMKSRWDNLLFCGFYALSLSEKRLIKSLEDEFNVKRYYDADNYYLNDKINEAGLFFRKNRNKNWKWKENIFSYDKKNIEIIGTSGNAGQAKITGNILYNIASTGNINYDNTVVVLPEESLLFPVLNYIPEQIENINVTMGYPLKNTLLYTLLDFIIQMYINKKEYQNDNYYWKDVVNIIYHPYVIPENIKIADDIISLIKKDNIVEIEHNILIKKLGNLPVKKLFVTNIHTTIDLINHLLLIFNLLKKEFKLKSDSKFIVELEYIYKIEELILKIKYEIIKTDIDISIKTFSLFFKDMIKNQTLPFEGEPLKGLQIMGLLETRCLDFENVIVLSNNEGILPTASQKMSFIPYEIRNEYDMPTIKFQDAIFAYHFYRLLTRAKNIYLLYNTQTDEFGKGGKSRFIEQLLYEYSIENKNAKITEKIISFPGKLIKPPEFIIPKENDIIQKIKNFTFSPTMINTYICCQMKFYFKYVLELKLETDVMEDPDAALLGTIVHEVLEKIYESKKKWTKIDLNNTVKKTNIKKEIEKIYIEQINNYKNSGMNLILSEVIEILIKKLIQDDCNNLKEDYPLEIINLEKKYTVNYKYEKDGLKIPVIISGKIDRIDKFNNIYRVMDYKNGIKNNVFFNKYKNTINDLTEITDILYKKKEAVQLLIYVYLFLKSEFMEFSNDAKVHAGIYWLKSTTDIAEYFRIDRSGNYIFSKKDLSTIEKFLFLIFDNIFNIQIPFKCTNDEVRCSNCDFNNICINE